MMRRKLVVSAFLLLPLVFVGCSSSTEEGAKGGEGGGLLSKVAPKAPPITVPAGTELDVRLTTALNSKENSAGDEFEATLDKPVTVGNKVVIPKGAEVKGKVTKAVPSGRLKQRAELWVTLSEISVNGKSYDISTSTTGHKEGSKTKRNILFIGGGTGAGALIGGLAGGGKGAAIGAAVGAGGGTAGAMVTGKRNIQFPPETLLRFELEQPVAIQP